LQIEEAIAGNLVSSAIIKFMEDKDEWIGTATELHIRLEEVAVTELKINVNNTKQWPKGANVLSGRLNEVKTNLREIGIIINNEAAKNPKTRVKSILIQKITGEKQEVCKQSFESLESFEDKNHAQIASDNPNDINEFERSCRSQPEGSFAKTQKNRAQNGGSSDTSDTLHVLEGNPENDIEQSSSEQQQQQQQIPDSIYRLGHSDKWACKNCNLRDDKWCMVKHPQYCRAARGQLIKQNSEVTKE
jgi:hypothetical protein